MPLMIKLNRNVVRVYLCLDNGHFITVYTMLVVVVREWSLNAVDVLSEELSTTLPVSVITD